MNRMLTDIRENLEKNKLLVVNFTFLSFLQVSNLVLFLVTVPYLFRVLGPRIYGLVVFAQAIVFYFSVFINFGFNLTATRDISVNRNDKGRISEIFSAVLSLKIFFFLVSFAVMLLATLFIPQLVEHRILFLFSMLAALNEALFPVWYFQGTEKMKYITVINVTTRIIATILVFVLIRSADDYIYYPLLVGLGMVTGAFTALSIILTREKIAFILLPVSKLAGFFRENFLYFVSNVSTQIYLNANRIIAGALLGLTELAIYDVAEKIINMVKVPYSLIGQTIFPKYSFDRNMGFIKKLMSYTLLFSVLLVILIWVSSSPLIKFFSGTINSDAVTVLRILSLSLLPISVSLFYGDLILITADLKKEYTALRFRALLFYFAVIIISYLTNTFSITALGIVVLLTEIFVAAMSYYLGSRALSVKG